MASRFLEQPSLNVSLAVGATPAGVYQHLARLATRGVVPLEEAHFFLWDEFFEPKSLIEADRGALRSSASTVGGERPHLHELEVNFFKAAQIPREHVHAPEAGLPVIAASSSYQELVKVRRGLDLAILGLAPNGQLGWLSAPVDPAQGVHVLDISGATPAQNLGYRSCVSLGWSQLLAAREVILLAVNRNKAEIVERVLADARGETAAGALLRRHPRVFFLLDVQAASRLLTRLAPRHAAPAALPAGLTLLEPVGAPALVRGRRVACVSPHPDDTSISAGATLALLSEHCEYVCSVVATTGHRAYIPNTSTAEERVRVREEEAREEAMQLGVQVRFLRLPLYERGSVVDEDDVRVALEYLEDARPDLIILPQTADTHQTHRAVARTFLLALQRYRHARPASRGELEVWMYEGPWSLFSKGSYNLIVSPSPDHFAKKMAAIAAHKSQTARTAYDRAADSLALLRGALVPEQDLSGWGENPPRLGDRLELFYRRPILTDDDIQQLLHWLDQQTPPRR